MTKLAGDLARLGEWQTVRGGTRWESLNMDAFFRSWRRSGSICLSLRLGKVLTTLSPLCFLPFPIFPPYAKFAMVSVVWEQANGLLLPNCHIPAVGLLVRTTLAASNGGLGVGYALLGAM